MKRYSFKQIDPKHAPAYRTVVESLVETRQEMNVNSFANTLLPSDLVAQAKIHAAQIIARKARAAKRNAKKHSTPATVFGMPKVAYNLFGMVRC